MGNLKNWQKLALQIADHFPKNKLTQDLAYKIISDRQVGYQAGATKSDIVRNVFSFKPKDEDTNKYMFVYGADTRRPETTIGQAYDWAEDIKENDYANVKAYEGVLNPYNEYLVDSRNKGLIEEFAKIGYSPVSNINNEYIDWNTYRRKQEVPYHDDVHGYRPTFHFNNGKPVISSSDLYDFGKNYVDDFVDLYADRSGTEIDPVFIMEAQRRALNSVGQPYLLVQKNIPIRFVDNPQGDEIWRTNNFNRELRLDEMSDREISNILHTGYIEPAVITAYKKGGRIHIKKKNRGKFTDYCGGKVTEECIAKGKNSKDPKIRKRATFAANAKKWKHENGEVLKVQEGTNELYPAGIAIPSNETIDFFKDFTQRYKKFNHIDKSQLIQDLISKDKAIVLKRGLPTYNTENKQIFIPSDDVGVSTYSHELVHKLNDLVLERTNKERKLLNDAYPLSIAKHVYGRAPEDMRNELIEDERFSTNTELRRKISSDYGNVLGKKLNKVIKSLSTNDIINYVNNINGYVGESDFLKYPEHIIDGKTLFEHWKEDMGDVPEYYNMPWEELPKSKQNQWQYLYDSREGVAPNYMIFDEDKPKAIKKALIKVAQESKSNDIRSKDFINVSRQGGILKAQDSAKLSNGYVQYNGSDLSDIETFNKNWLNYRNSQLANQGWKDESIKNKLNWFQRNFGASDKTVANLVREQLFSNLDNTKELSFSDALKDSQGRYLLTESMYADFPGERKLHEVEVGPPKPIEDWKLDYSFNGSVGGTHYPDFNTIIYNDLYQNTPIKIHERDHAMFGKYNDKNIGLRIVENIFKQDFLDNVSDKWGYYDDPGEIRARLMQMRYNNQLDPKHKYTLEEIENMRNNPTFIDEHIFDRYTNKYIEYLLNDVAQNNMNENRLDYRSPINFAKDGGILKAQGGTGNLYAPHPLSPVDIALNQAKAMAKGKKDQQHLPPGVKEVIGPDGQKIAIRTEQPLMPLEQSIAEWLPGTGDVAEVGQIVNDVKNGNLGTAALAAGLMVLPGNARKILDKFGVDLGDISTFKRLSDQEWDDMYFQAIDSGDMGLVQTIRDAHFKVKAAGASVDADGSLIKTYRGQYPKQKYEKHDLNPFSDKRDTHGSSGYFSSTSSQIADTYVQPGGDKFELYTNFTNPSVVDAKGKGYKIAVSQVEPDGRVVGIQTDAYVNKAFGQGYDGVIIKNVKDASVGNNLNDLEKIADDYVGAAGRSKLADPITREFDIFTGDYEIIPISRRDNFNMSDIRYGITPLILGLGTAKAVSNNSNTKEQR